MLIKSGISGYRIAADEQNVYIYEFMMVKLNSSRWKLYGLPNELVEYYTISTVTYDLPFISLTFFTIALLLFDSV